MSAFHSTLRVDDNPLTVEQVRERLEDSEAPLLQPGDWGILQYRTGDGAKRTLLVHDAGDGRFALAYDIYSPSDHACNAMWVSQGMGDMKEFIALPLGEVLPEGALINGLEATVALRQFLDAPMIPPESLDWKNTAELDWPEDMI